MPAVPLTVDATITFRHNVLSMRSIFFFVTAATGLLSVIAEGFPIGFVADQGANTLALLFVALAMPLSFSYGRGTRARHAPSASGPHALSACGLGSLAGAPAGTSATTPRAILQIGVSGGVTASALGLQAPWGTCSFLAMPRIAMRRPDLGAGYWRTPVRPAFSCVAPLAVLVVAVMHFDTLASASPALSCLLCPVIPAALVVGVLLSLHLRLKAPHRFAMLGDHKL